MIAGTSFGNLFTLIPRRHPIIKTPIVDYNIVLILMPGLLLGSTIGVLINKFLFEMLQDAVLIVVMVIFSIFYLKNYFLIKKKINGEIAP